MELFTAPVPTLELRGQRLALDQPRIMGIVNLTPDSFSDGGRWLEPEAAVAHALQLVEEGADLLDLGAESTRPGAAPVAAEEELRRLLPVLERLVPYCRVPISVDTSKPEVMRAAVAAGAAMINDVRALTLPGALAAVAELGVPVCLMHMQGQPDSMQLAPHYAEVVAEVLRFLTGRLMACRMAGIEPRQCLADPGFGFGKSLPHNLALLGQLERFATLGVPLLVGLSRKKMIGELTGRPLDQRAAGSVAAALLAVDAGARIVRVHDVAATRDALAIWQAVQPHRPQRLPPAPTRNDPAAAARALFGDD